MKRAIIIFTRIPLPGKTKTRMMPALSGRKCAALHTCFLKDIYAACRKADADIFVDYTPEDADRVNVLKDIFGGEVSYFIQEGDTLGERMYQGIRYVLDQVVDRIVEIKDGRAEFYEGSYSFYSVEKERRYEEQLRRYEKEQAKIEQLEKAAEAFEHFLSIVYGWFVSLNGSLRPSAALS